MNTAAQTLARMYFRTENKQFPFINNIGVENKVNENFSGDFPKTLLSISFSPNFFLLHVVQQLSRERKGRQNFFYLPPLFLFHFCYLHFF